MLDVEKMTTHNLMVVVRDPYHSDEERQQARQEIARRQAEARLEDGEDRG